MSNAIAWDLEVVKDLKDATKWRDERPLGISCVAVLGSDEPLSMLYYHGRGYFEHPKSPISGEMTKEELQELVQDFILWQSQSDTPIISWNGLSFDFDVLAEESGMYDECRELALNHIDMMFHFFCIKGFPVGLDAVARGMGFGGKMAGMSGALAPKLWASDKLSDRLRVLRYVHQDAVSTMEVYERTSELGGVIWITQKGKQSSTPLFGGWKTVKECLELPTPDNSWMDTPMNREDFYDWTQK